MPRAFISVYNKTGLDVFAQGLAELGWDLVASGWTSAPEQGESRQVFGSDIGVSLERYKVLRLPPEQS